MIHENPKRPEIGFVMANLRAKAEEELFALDMRPADVADRIWYAPGFKWVAYDDRAPAALFGAFVDRPGVYSLFGLATDRWPAVGRLVTLASRRTMMPALLAAGAHRAHCFSLATHKDTHRWLRALGAKEELPFDGYGANGEDFRMFVWRRDHVLRRT